MIVGKLSKHSQQAFHFEKDFIRGYDLQKKIQLTPIFSYALRAPTCFLSVPLKGKSFSKEINFLILGTRSSDLILMDSSLIYVADTVTIIQPILPSWNNYKNDVSNLFYAYYINSTSTFKKLFAVEALNNDLPNY